MTVEIVKRLTAQLKYNAETLSKAAQIKTDILPAMKAEFANIANIRSGEDKAIELAKSAIEELENLVALNAKADNTIEAGLYHIEEGVDDLDKLASDLLDNAQLMAMFPIWFQANPEITRDAIELSTEYSWGMALQGIDLEMIKLKMAAMQAEINKREIDTDG